VAHKESYPKFLKTDIPYGKFIFHPMSSPLTNAVPTPARSMPGDAAITSDPVVITVEA
jgi:hypothetical protein